MSEALDFERRFGGVARLYGAMGVAKFQAAHIVVIGIGGVGSWAAEALARNAIGAITLIDLDNIAESNVNRQIHAVEGAFGKAKVTAMHERILSINPNCKVTEVEDFVTPENIEKILNFQLDGIVDCIDDAKAKAALAAFCQANKTPLIMTGAAGGRLDATRIKTNDLAQVTGDKLLAKVRNILRKDYGFPKGRDGINAKQVKMQIPCVYSDEPVIMPLGTNKDEVSSDVDLTSCDLDTSITGLNCAGYGSSVCVTAPFGFVAAGLMLNALIV